MMCFRAEGGCFYDVRQTPALLQTGLIAIAVCWLLESSFDSAVLPVMMGMLVIGLT